MRSHKGIGRHTAHQIYLDQRDKKVAAYEEKQKEQSDPSYLSILAERLAAHNARHAGQVVITEAELRSLSKTKRGQQMTKHKRLEILAAQRLPHILM